MSKPLPVPVAKPWHMTGARVLSFRERLRLLCGTPIFARFLSPDGRCHAACSIEFFVQDDWPPPDAREAWHHKTSGNPQRTDTESFGAKG